MTEREQYLAGIKRLLDRAGLGSSFAPVTVAWLVVRLEERDRGFDLAMARIERLEAALRAARISAVREMVTGRLIYGLPVNIDEHNARIDAALRGEP